MKRLLNVTEILWMPLLIAGAALPVGIAICYLACLIVGGVDAPPFPRSFA